MNNIHEGSNNITAKGQVNLIIQQYIKDELKKHSMFKNHDKNQTCRRRDPSKDKNCSSNSKIQSSRDSEGCKSQLFKRRNPSANEEALRLLNEIHEKKNQIVFEEKKVIPNKIIATQSTNEGSNYSGAGSFVKLKDTISQEREQLIKYNKAFFIKNKQFPKTNLDYYKFVKVIGKGAFGVVSLGIHKLTGKYVAIKLIDKECLKDEFSKKKVLREIHILRKINHSNVIKLLEVFQSTEHILIVMEYAEGGDLLHYIKIKSKINEDEAKNIFRQVCLLDCIWFSSYSFKKCYS